LTCENHRSTGTRSVSTLTPAQLARKRANDREAQRAIRARTKEHIENLEREIEELRSRQNRDETVQDLLRKNRALEDELHRLKESLGISTNGPRGYYPPCMFARFPNTPVVSLFFTSTSSPLPWTLGVAPQATNNEADHGRVQPTITIAQARDPPRQA
jgi:hypothetical protein